MKNWKVKGFNLPSDFYVTEPSKQNASKAHLQAVWESIVA